MRKNTKNIFCIAFNGGFISCDSNSTRELFYDLEENFEDYADYFSEIGQKLIKGDGYYYMVSLPSHQISKLTVIKRNFEVIRKLLDWYRFLLCYDPEFNVGSQLKRSDILTKMRNDPKLMKEAEDIRRKYNLFTDDEVVSMFLDCLMEYKFIECLDEQLENYKAVSAYKYLDRSIKQFEKLCNDPTFFV